MRIRTLLFPVLALGCLNAAWAGPYAGGSDTGSGAGISSNDSRIVGWATSVVDLTRGPTDITNTNSALASFGDTTQATGPATGYTGDAGVVDPLKVVSLGDGGSITLAFGMAITNGAGADFAVFENSFKQGTNAYFLELAFVEVSSNGTDFFRFPSISLTQTTTQVAGGGTLDPSNIFNLAGKDLSGFGTPFDLNDLVGVSPLLDVNNILYVRVVDVVGSINPLYGTKDSAGNYINDPFTTNFNTGGFDFDAIGVLNQIPEPGTVALFSLGFMLVAGAAYRRKRSHLSKEI